MEKHKIFPLVPGSAFASRKDINMNPPVPPASCPPAPWPWPTSLSPSLMHPYLQPLGAQGTELYCTEVNCTESVLGQDEGYTVEFSALAEGVLEGEAGGNSQRQRALFDHITQVES